MSSPNRLPTRLERRIIALRITRRWGPHRIAFHLHLARSTVGRVLARFRMPLLRNIDQATGLPVCRPTPVRYEKSRPGEAVMTDNGSCCRSRDFAAALGDVKHRFTRHYRAPTNGKVERFDRTLAAEWAYARHYDSDAARTAT